MFEMQTYTSYSIRNRKFLMPLLFNESPQLIFFLSAVVRNFTMKVLNLIIKTQTKIKKSFCTVAHTIQRTLHSKDLSSLELARLFVYISSAAIALLPFRTIIYSQAPGTRKPGSLYFRTRTEYK